MGAPEDGSDVGGRLEQLEELLLELVQLDGGDAWGVRKRGVGEEVVPSNLNAFGICWRGQLIQPGHYFLGMFSFESPDV